MSYGVNQYRRSEGNAMSPRETEAAAFCFVNRLLAQAADPVLRTKALAKNQQLWSLLVRDVGSSLNALPPILKSDLLKVGLFAVRQSIAAMGDNRSVSFLMQINEDMIAALRTDTVLSSPMPSPAARSAMVTHFQSVAG